MQDANTNETVPEDLPIDCFDEIKQLHISFLNEINPYLGRGDKVLPGRFEDAFEEMKAYLQHPGDGTVTACFVFRVESRICGFATCDLFQGRVRIMELYVAPDKRNSGIASDLIASCMDWGRIARAEVIEISAHVGNESSSRLYPKLGFKPYLITMRQNLTCHGA